MGLYLWRSTDQSRRSLSGAPGQRRWPGVAPNFEDLEAEILAGLAGAPGRTRTYDTRFRKPLLYPLSYGG